MASVIQLVALCISGFGYIVAMISYLADGKYAMAVCMICYAISCGALLMVASK